MDLKHRPFRERLRFFGRFDALDQGRAVLVIEEAWAEYKKGPVRIRAGLDILNWTATEAFHPADIINSRNLDSDVENFEKLGEPMLALQWRFGSGAINAYYMPAYPSPIFPSRASRLGFGPPGLELGDAVRLGPDGEKLSGAALQGALRYTQTIGHVDLGLHVVHHLDRSQPSIVFDPEALTLAPLYRTVTQIGGTYQHVIEGLILKVEAGYRIFSATGIATPYGMLPDLDHAQLAVGFEYGLLHESGVESTFILEGQALVGLDEAERLSASIFQRDVLFGYRISLNDTAGTTLLLSAIADLERAGEVLVSFSYACRLSDTFTLKAAARVYEAKAPTGRQPSGLELLRNSDHFRVSLIRYF